MMSALLVPCPCGEVQIDNGESLMSEARGSMTLCMRDPSFATGLAEHCRHIQPGIGVAL